MNIKRIKEIEKDIRKQKLLKEDLIKSLAQAKYEALIVRTMNRDYESKIKSSREMLAQTSVKTKDLWQIILKGVIYVILNWKKVKSIVGDIRNYISQLKNHLTIE